MTNMNDREKAFENKFAHDAELQFRVEARRNKLLALWAADLHGKTGDAVDAYIAEVIESDFEEAGDEDVLRKVLGDFEAANITVTREEVRAKLDAYFVEAKQQLMEE